MAKYNFANAKWLLLSLLVILLDQLSKQLIIHHLVLHDPVALLPWLNFMLSYNTGMAFSMLSYGGGWQRWFLTIVSIVVSIVILSWMMDKKTENKWLLAALALIVGGALSNLIDRLSQGFVTDFIDFHLGTWHFATFNVADSAITLGAILLGGLLIFKKV